MIQQLRDHFLTVGKLEDCLQKLQARKCSYPSDARMTLSNSRWKGGSMESSLDKSLVGIRRISAGESGRISIPPLPEVKKLLGHFLYEIWRWKD